MVIIWIVTAAIKQAIPERSSKIILRTVQAKNNKYMRSLITHNKNYTQLAPAIVTARTRSTRETYDNTHQHNCPEKENYSFSDIWTE